MLLNKLEFRMAILAVTREYTPGSSHISKKLMRLPTRSKIRPDSHALGVEEFRVPNQTHKEPQFS